MPRGWISWVRGLHALQAQGCHSLCVCVDICAQWVIREGLVKVDGGCSTGRSTAQHSTAARRSTAGIKCQPHCRSHVTCPGFTLLCACSAFEGFTLQHEQPPNGGLHATTRITVRTAQAASCQMPHDHGRVHTPLVSWWEGVWVSGRGVGFDQGIRHGDVPCMLVTCRQGCSTCEWVEMNAMACSGAAAPTSPAQCNASAGHPACSATQLACCFGCACHCRHSPSRCIQPGCFMAGALVLAGGRAGAWGSLLAARPAGRRA